MASDFKFLDNTLLELTKAEPHEKTQTPAMGWADPVLLAQKSLQP